MSSIKSTRLFDSHTHLWDPQFDRDREDVIRRMRELGMGAIQVGTDVKTSEAALQLAEANDNFWAAAGQHPTDTKNDFDAVAFETLARHPKVIAIGECGLDYAVFARALSARMQKRASAEAESEGGFEEEKQRQINLFRAQIRLAKNVSKPLMIHCRPRLRQGFGGQAVAYSTDAYDDVFRIIKEESGEQVGGVLHFFVGSQDVARKFLDIGFSFSFSGVITITPMYDDVARFIPPDRLLIETDAPYAAPLPYRGKRNEPAYVVEVARRLADIRSVSFDEIAAQTTENARRIFKLG